MHSSLSNNNNPCNQCSLISFFFINSVRYIQLIYYIFHLSYDSVESLDNVDSQAFHTYHKFTSNSSKYHHRFQQASVRSPFEHARLQTVASKIGIRPVVVNRCRMEHISAVQPWSGENTNLALISCTEMRNYRQI